MIIKKIFELLIALSVGVAKLDTTCKPNTTRHEISRLWVKT